MKLTPEQQHKIIELKHIGFGSRYIAGVVGCSKSTVNNFLTMIKTKPMYDPNDVAFKSKLKKPRILLLDIETAPDVSATFSRFKTNIGIDNVVREGGWIISAAWQWLGEKEIYSARVSSEQALESNDSHVLAELYEVLEECDAVVAHNAERFDIPVIKARLVANSFPAPKKFKVIDTLRIAKQMRFQSNKLDYLGKVLCEERKQEHEGIKLWIDCIHGDEDALDRMVTYNVQDVVLLEKVYNRIKHIDSKPVNMGLFYKDEQQHCPACGSTDVVYTGNSVYTQVSEFKEVLCSSCGHRSRERTAINSKAKRKSLLM